MTKEGEQTLVKVELTQLSAELKAGIRNDGGLCGNLAGAIRTLHPHHDPMQFKLNDRIRREAPSKFDGSRSVHAYKRAEWADIPVVPHAGSMYVLFLLPCKHR